MLRNYFITAFRYIIRNKIQSVIQILSLSIGITAIVLIGLYVDHELSCDKFNEKLDRIYRLEYGDEARIPSAVGHEIKENFTEVENVVRLCGPPNRYTRITYVSVGDERLKKKISLRARYYRCDSTIFDVFTLPFIQGNPKTALRDPYSIVLTESTARALFGNKDPIGEVVYIGEVIDFDQQPPHIVTGIIQDVGNSHIDFDYLVSSTSLIEIDKVNPHISGDSRLNSYRIVYPTYLLLPHPHDQTRTGKNLNAFFSDKMKGSPYHSEGSVFSMRPLEEIYFESPMNNELGYCLHGNLKLVKMLMAIAIIILLLACINYINLTTARASLRIREVGVRKVVGSRKSRLMVQFLLESVLISLVSFLLAITIVQVLLPTFIQMTGYELSIERLFQPRTILFTAACIILLGVMAGIFPAIYMARFQPVASLKGELRTGVRSVLIRRILLSLQFAVFVILMIGVYTILRQLTYMKTADLGFDKELVVNISHSGLNGPNQFDRRRLFKESLLQHPNITKVAFGHQPGQGSADRKIPDFVEYRGKQIKPNWCVIDPDYFDLMDVKILTGRNFSWDREADLLREDSLNMLWRVIINETAMQEWDLDLPIGAILTTESGWRMEIIGVVEDFHFFSLHYEIEPTLYIYLNRSYGANIKLLPNDIQGTIKDIKKEYESAVPTRIFQYSFLDETYDQQYEGDERLFKIISNFAIVALLIGCLGLFGLSTFMAARRTKEIGIRKAMGASVRIVFLLLAREFAIWVSLSIIFACPVAWIIMNRWLQGFAYRTNISWWIFMLTIIIAFAIAFLTVAWQSLKTARTNPVDALRYE